MRVSKEKFLAYEAIRESGITNMFDVDYVVKFSEEMGVPLTRQEIFQIMSNYELYSEEYSKPARNRRLAELNREPF